MILAAVIMMMAATVTRAAEPALNILVYGNSFMNGTNVPEVFSCVARADAKTQPNIINASVNSQALSFHIAVQNSNVPVSPNTTVKHWINDSTLNKNATGKWDYVVLQEFSTKPTDIAYANQGNPTAFKNDALTLYNLVRADSPGVKPVLFETWARAPGSDWELRMFYPSLVPSTGATPAQYRAASNKMQEELRTYYTQAQAFLGGAQECLLAPVGDAFQAMNFDTSLYNPDNYHESGKGAVLGALILYRTIYKESVSDIPYSQMNGFMNQKLGGLPNYGIPNAAAWQSMTAFVDATVPVPEPACVALMGLAGVVALRRR